MGESWPPTGLVRPWDSLSDDEKRLFSRMAEVYAGFSEYTDHHVGRIIDYLEESGHPGRHVLGLPDRGQRLMGGEGRHRKGSSALSQDSPAGRARHQPAGASVHGAQAP